MLLMIDNYDSFTYNLVQCFLQLGEEVRVVRNDAIDPDGVERSHPDRIVLSPGPSIPGNAGCTVEVARRMVGRVPILGVCLGHQAVGQAFGGLIVRANEVWHGKVSQISHDGSSLFRGVEDPFPATRYHSLVIERATLPTRFEVTAWSNEDGEIMAIADRSARLFGLQFHPESYMTGAGMGILKNFLDHS